MHSKSQGKPSRWLPATVPLRWHLVALVVGTLFPLIIFAVVVTRQLAAEQRAAALRRLTHSSGLLAQAVEREVFGSVRVLEALSASPHLTTGNLDAFDREVREIRTTQPSWLAVVVLSPEGQQLVNTLRPRGSQLPPALETGSLQELVRTRRVTVGPCVRTRFGQWGFAVRVPVVRGSRLKYVLTAAISTTGLAQVVSLRNPPDPEWTRTVVDGKGVVLARTRSPERYVGKSATPTFLERTRAADSGVYRDISLDHKPVWLGFQRVDPFGWTVAVTAPAASLDAPLRQRVAAVTGVGLVLILLAGAGAYFLSRGVSREIAAAARAAEALARGDSLPPGNPTVAEVRWLRSSLDRSAGLLRVRERERDLHLREAEAARREAEASSRAKDDFLALLGHELRNPLAPITNTLDLIRARGETRPKDLEILLRQSRHLSLLVDDLLDVSHITRGAVELRREPLELRSAVEAAVEMVSPLIQERGHRLEVDVPAEGLMVNADPLRMAQIISNLLTNAARYTPQPGEIRLSAARSGGEAGDRIVLEVRDNGQGLPPELAERIFEMFVQGPRTIDRQQGGLGLGLTIVRSLVELHGGTVVALSAGPGQGSTFQVHLPAFEGASVASLAAGGGLG